MILHRIRNRPRASCRPLSADRRRYSLLHFHRESCGRRPCSPLRDEAAAVLADFVTAKGIDEASRIWSYALLGEQAKADALATEIDSRFLGAYRLGTDLNWVTGDHFPVSFEHMPNLARLLREAGLSEPQLAAVEPEDSHRPSWEPQVNLRLIRPPRRGPVPASADAGGRRSFRPTPSAPCVCPAPRCGRRRAPGFDRRS